MGVLPERESVTPVATRQVHVLATQENGALGYHPTPTPTSPSTRISVVKFTEGLEVGEGRGWGIQGTSTEV